MRNKRFVRNHVAQPPAQDGASSSVILRKPSHQAAAKPATYMSPYHRIASGPIEKAIGSMLGCTSM